MGELASSEMFELYGNPILGQCIVLLDQGLLPVSICGAESIVQNQGV